jgi:hypothetical protein
MAALKQGAEPRRAESIRVDIDIDIDIKIKMYCTPRVADLK